MEPLRLRLRCLLFLVFFAAHLVWGICARAANDVTGTPLLFNDNAAWSWFEDERAIVDTANNKLLVSSVADSAGSGGAARNGDIELATLNFSNLSVSPFLLRDNLQADDHDSAALVIRPDGRYLAMYSTHGSDNFTRYRISTNPGDSASWGPEQTINNGAGTTYSNLHYLPNDNGGAGRMYNFTRSVNFNPNVMYSNDQGTTWNYGGKLLTIGTGGTRPYVRYWNDQNRIHLITTDGHPRDVDNSIYYGYVQDGQLFRSDGSIADADLFDGGSGPSVAPSALTTVFDNGTIVDGAAMRRAWTVDIAADGGGNPVAVFQARANNLTTDHRFFYARWNGSQWQVNPLGYAGSYLYSSEDDYTGLVAIDPRDVNTVYLSSEVNPVTKAQLIGADGVRHYEIFKGVTTNGGLSWNWSPVTFNSTQQNVRPIVPKWNATNTALLWMRGTYTSYTNWNMDAVGLLNPVVPNPQLALAIDFGLTGQLVQGGFQAFTRAADPPGNEQTSLFSSAYGAGGGQIAVTVGGGNVQFFDRGDDVDSPIGDLADDFALVGGDMTLTLGNLARGSYELVLYGHDRDVDQATANILLNGVPLGVMDPSTGASPTIGVSSSRIAFSMKNAGDAAFALDGVAGSGNAILNGFELYFIDSTPRPLVDLNSDGDLNLADLGLFAAGMHTSLAGLPFADAYAHGDLNGDFQNNYADFVLFRNAYDLWNGNNAFVAGMEQVPEPASAGLLLVAVLLAVNMCFRRSSARPSLILVTACGLVALTDRVVAAQLIYVDATAGGNTTPASAFLAGSNNGAADNLWTLRTPFASGGTAYQAGDGANGENAPELTTTISGLTPNTLYSFYVHFWDAATWPIRAGFTSGNLSLYAEPNDAAGFGAQSAVRADSLTYSTAPTIMVESNRTMFAGLVGVTKSSANGQAIVYVDDLPSTNGLNNRTWYDGLSYQPASILTLRVNTATGGITIRNDTAAQLDMNYYEIRSASAALNGVKWNSLDDQDSTAGGSAWHEAGGSSANILSEFNVQGMKSFGTAGSASLGNSFTVGGAQNLLFAYGLVGGSSLQTGYVEYFSLPGDYNNDGGVNTADYVVWRKTDGNNAAGFAAWRNNFGAASGAGSGDALAGANAVPEPAVSILVVLVISVVFCRLRCR
jgi:hypothetical protein